MVLGNTKRIVIIKDIHSNLIEEAILILKSDSGLSKVNDPTSIIKNNKDNGYLLNEAESVINNFIKENKYKIASGIDLNFKEVNMSKSKIFRNMIINLALAGTLVLLIYAVANFF
ncbi:hypothetical protein [Pseudobacteroides cellulosolvens]|uniref:Uncharacterized protein n=1 Tax=Pseudobacteroides cellulosolvens ATCC 35603 = DSM 2933 TaxID=398512 RepID=A0A0L6JN56_9FIRM|nr:hypothetical protein [Pseudobacteroides cellulosolvens]KNY27180.1 hypothetical protein Bccel_2448 [Pseudobacteroides cellulosolvens ATCC 35603 = DSM 2933]